MTLRKNILIIISFLLLFLIISFAQENNQKNVKIDEKNKIQTKVDIKTKTIWNAFCPVMGEPVDPDVQTVEYNGNVIGFCCKSCIKKFKKDPENYLKNLSEDGQKFIK